MNGERFNQPDLAARAATLARAHRLAADSVKSRPLVPRLDENASQLELAFEFLSETVHAAGEPVASEEWLRDNRHVVYDEVRQIRQNLSTKDYSDLSRLAEGPFAGYPRVYVIARELIALTAGRVDLETLITFTTEYQRLAPLSIAETRALRIMLRLALVEELRDLSDGVISARRIRTLVRRWQEVSIDSPRTSTSALDELFRTERRTSGRLSSPFVAEMLQSFREQPSLLASARGPLWSALAAQGDSPEEMRSTENRREAAAQLAIGNVVTSMRLVASIDWTLFLEQVNPVEHILRGDPQGDYVDMDLPTRESYRDAVTHIANQAKCRETTVALAVIDLARDAERMQPQNDRVHHVGYYLVGDGRIRLERQLGYPLRSRERLTRFLKRHSASSYLAAIACVAALFVCVLLAYAAQHAAILAEQYIAAVVIVLPVSQLAISLVNLIIASRVPLRPLPKLGLRAGIPPRGRAIVVVQAIVDSMEQLGSLLEGLEVRFLANRDPHLHFALLSDFGDADQPSQPDDASILEVARARIDELNTRHGNGTFFLFHRERRWNPRERRWMGWGRKRGKLAEFNRLLRGATDTSFIVRRGDLSVLPSVRYVIALDSQTQLPPDAARRLVGTLMHPLNRAWFDLHQRVKAGYVALQPKVDVDLVSGNRSTFSKAFSRELVFDPYSKTASHVYQAVFGEGCYLGKGIYDVDALNRALASRVSEVPLPTDTLANELYARAGLCIDIRLVDDCPSGYLSFAALQHRWVRGNWQIIRWLSRSPHDASDRIAFGRLPLVARLTILDNLRRTVLPPALLIFLIAGWTVLSGSPALWTFVALLVLSLPEHAQVGPFDGPLSRGAPLREHIRAARYNIIGGLQRTFLYSAMLAHQSVVNLDAIARSLDGLPIPHRTLADWVATDCVEATHDLMTDTFRRMWSAPVLAVAIAAVVAARSPIRLVAAAPLVALWFMSPALAHLTRRPLARIPSLSAAERRAFRAMARRIWLFYEDLVGPTDHWLVPYTYHDDRREVAQHRSSPTTVGLQLLSTLSAHDLGYSSLTLVLDRLEHTFETLLRLPRYRGHFFSWYDTQSLAPVTPLYISTVDSGNLAAYLLTLRSGLHEIVQHAPIISFSFSEGVADALVIFENEVATANERVPDTFGKELKDLRALLNQRPESLADWSDHLVAISLMLNVMTRLWRNDAPAECSSRSVHGAFEWLERAASSVNERRLELQRLTSWVDALRATGASISSPRPVPSLVELVAWCERSLQALQTTSSTTELHAAIDRAQVYAKELIDRAEHLGTYANDLVEETDFNFLFNRQTELFFTGFNVSDGRMDNSYLDTLASDARLASFVAIATWKISSEHWFRLGRPMVASGTSRALLSSSASMHEYLMPPLVMRTHPGTVLDETYTAVVRRQIQYGAQRHVPWGISESAYLDQDIEGNYRYRAFGVPGLGLKRGLADDLVIAPYATMLAAPFAPAQALKNLERLRSEGMTGRYGHFEAIDYTVARLPENHNGGIALRIYMAHHQGVSLLALNGLLNQSPMQNRFHADPRVRAAEPLLQERILHLVPLKSPPLERRKQTPSVARLPPASLRRYVTPHTSSPQTHLLSNGSYSLMLTNAGGGYSRWQNVALTRWREDITTDAWGSFIYVRDLETGELWSTAYQPTTREPDNYEVTFAADRAIWRRLDHEIEVRTEVVVSPEDNAEIRRVSLTNHSHRVRSLDLTSYAEVVLAPANADRAHPAFSNLFIETIAVPERDALIGVRRSRTATDRRYLIHVLSGPGGMGGTTEYETDRARFVGRGHTLARPVALLTTTPLSNTTGAVLDPIVSLRQSVRIPPGGSARLAFTTAFADTEDAALQLIEKYQDRRAVARTLALASTHSQIELRHLGLTNEEAIRFQDLAGRLLYGDAILRDRDAARTNSHGQATLWQYGISGDLPILLLRLKDVAEVPLFRELLKAHEYLRLKGLSFDLVVLNEHISTNVDLEISLSQLIASGPEAALVDRPGGVFLRRSELMSSEDQTLLRAAARVVIEAANGDLYEQLEGTHDPFWEEPGRIGAFTGRLSVDDRQPMSDVSGSGNLEMFNGVGGFADDGREYVIDVDQDAGTLPPAPWVNVVAQPTFGFASSECGPGYTWSENSHNNRLTPWRNDPVSDVPGEAMFIRDENTRRFWSITPLPCGAGRPYKVRHGQGYTSFTHTRDGLLSTLLLFVPPTDAIKIYQLTLRNESAQRRRYTVTLYVEWVLGVDREQTQLHVVTTQDAVTGALLARNPFRQEFANRVAFLDLHPGGERTVTGDRMEFLGRNGTLGQPAALQRTSLSGRTGAALDPCGAVQVAIALEPSETRTLMGLLGEATDAEHARVLVQRYREPKVVDDAFQLTRESWNRLLDTLVVRTPDRSMDLLLNRWLLYQTLGCRIWGRTAFYQSSGAFGFRDQLQDVLAMLLSSPAVVRGHLLHAASRQFVEGDVQHWWHEPGGVGVRSRSSDDRLWLVYATLQYLTATGDASVLDEQIPFLEGRVLGAGEHEAYECPSVSLENGSLYEHCVRAVALSLYTGAHGLPLMGTGDWNDGMNLVGVQGQGESVWLGWFLVSILQPFADLAVARGDEEHGTLYRHHAARIAEALEQAWDGAWYRRAYFDDGTPLGTAESTECRIDSVSQSWAVISGSADEARARKALEAIDQHLVQRPNGLVQMLTPPFDRMAPNAGHIQAYLPGVRENGGQYTQAAVWAVLAFAMTGNGDKAAELFALINPINHTKDRGQIDRYRVEPYVMAGDVYSRSPHIGRGGWTWYTGSAGWMYRVGIEHILGITLRGGAISIDPCVPRTWTRYEAFLRATSAYYRIVVENPDGVNRGVIRVEVDGIEHATPEIALSNDGAAHHVLVLMGRIGDKGRDSGEA